MASIFASVLSALAGIVNNGVSTFTILLTWDETDCPEELL